MIICVLSEGSFQAVVQAAYWLSTLRITFANKAPYSLVFVVELKKKKKYW